MDIILSVLKGKVFVALLLYAAAVYYMATTVGAGKYFKRTEGLSFMVSAFLGVIWPMSLPINYGGCIMSRAFHSLHDRINAKNVNPVKTKSVEESVEKDVGKAVKDAILPLEKAIKELSYSTRQYKTGYQRRYSRKPDRAEAGEASGEKTEDKDKEKQKKIEELLNQ